MASDRKEMHTKPFSNLKEGPGVRKCPVDIFSEEPDSGKVNEGYKHIVEIDLKSFFDEVDHAILLQLIYRKVKCPTTLRLIRLWLRTPIVINGKLTKRRKGAELKKMSGGHF